MRPVTSRNSSVTCLPQGKSSEGYAEDALADWSSIVTIYFTHSIGILTGMSSALQTGLFSGA